MKVLTTDAVDMVGIVTRHAEDALSMLEFGLAGLRFLTENGLHESRLVQARALIAGLLHTGKFLDVAAALAEAQHSTTEDPQDAALLELVRAVQRGGPKPW